jgi:pimeloyl-ACP methyl ester carboxylesterase
MKLVFHDPSFSFQLLRILGQTYYGGSDIGECLSTAYRIKEGDTESWYNEWLKTADRVYKYAEYCNSVGHKTSACKGYLRASTYYQNGAAFYLDINPSDSRIVPTWQKGIESFSKAAKLFSPPIETIEISYEGITIPGYFYKVDNDDNARRPTVILSTGLDGSQEELYFLGGAAALQRGYNCITYEGPGQGSVIRNQKLPFRPDWEKVVTPVVDFALNRNQVDPKRIALIGYSMGGYLAPRAAAFDDRIMACIADDGVFSIYEAYIRHLQMIHNEIKNGHDHIVNKVIETIMHFDIGTRWKITHSMWVFGAKSPLELIQKISEYTMEGIEHKIKCPTLLLAGEKDASFPGQAQILYDLLKCPKKYILFTTEEGAEDHCHPVALSLANQRIFDWLDETFVRTRS